LPNLSRMIICILCMRIVRAGIGYPLSIKNQDTYAYSLPKCVLSQFDVSSFCSASARIAVCLQSELAFYSLCNYLTTSARLLPRSSQPVVQETLAPLLLFMLFGKVQPVKEFPYRLLFTSSKFLSVSFQPRCNGFPLFAKRKIPLG